MENQHKREIFKKIYTCKNRKYEKNDSKLFFFFSFVEQIKINCFHPLLSQSDGHNIFDGFEAGPIWGKF